MVLEKKLFEKSINCLKPMGTMISFGNASGALDPIDVKKYIAHKSLFFTRPGLAHYGAGRTALEEGASALFEQIKFGRIKINILKNTNFLKQKKPTKIWREKNFGSSCIDTELNYEIYKSLYKYM